MLRHDQHTSGPVLIVPRMYRSRMIFINLFKVQLHACIMYTYDWIKLAPTLADLFVTFEPFGETWKLINVPN